MHQIKLHCDEDLLKQMRSDDNPEKAFEELYGRYWQKLYLLAYNRLRERELCEEIVQDFFASLWSKRTSVKVNGSFIGYVHQAVRYQIINHWHSKSIRKKHLASSHLTQIADYNTENLINLNDLSRVINAQVHALPERCRQVYTLSRNNYKTNREIANELGISEKTVENQLTKALKRLRDTIKQAALMIAICIHFTWNNFF